MDLGIQLNQLPFYPTISKCRARTIRNGRANDFSLTFCIKAMAEESPRPPISARELIGSGVVRSIQPKEAAKAMSDENFVLLDIRPEWEREKACVSGSLTVPLFVGDPDNSPITLLKKWIHLGYIGLWTGQRFTMFNPDFLPQVEAALPDKETKVLVACGEGLRSMMAVSRLHTGGYKNLGWLAGGFNRSTDKDFPSVDGPEKLQYATIGGVSFYFLQLLLFIQGTNKLD